VILQSVTGPGSYDADGVHGSVGWMHGKITKKRKKKQQKPKKEQILVRRTALSLRNRDGRTDGVTGAIGSWRVNLRGLPLLLIS